MAKAKNNQQEESGVLMYIPLELVDENPDNEKIFNMDDITELADSIKRIGLTEPIIVFAKPDKRYEIQAGHRRKRACEKLGWKTIPAIVKQVPDEILRRSILVLSNTDVRKLNPLDVARLVAYHEETLRRKYGVTGSKKKDINIMREVSSELGMSEMTAFRYKNLLSVDPSIQAMVERGELSWRAAADCAQLSAPLQEAIANDYEVELSTSMRLEKESTPSISANRAASILKKYQDLMPKKGNKKQKSEPMPVKNEIKDEDNKNLDVQRIESNFNFDYTIFAEEEKKISADALIEDAVTSLDKLSSGEFEISDKEVCLEKIKYIEKMIREFKKKL